MLALGRFLQAQAQAVDGGDHQYDSLVEQLVQRLSEAQLVGDRRDALQQLRDLLSVSAKAQLAFGSVGFPAMLQIVRDREDLEMVQLALENLVAAVASGGGSAGDDAAANQAAAINAQQLARTAEGLPLLLSLLDQEPDGIGDFYARYHTLQVFKGLVAAAPRLLQEAILGAPLGVTRLMDLLGEQEVLRNEALLLLTQLAAGSAELQKIAVFEGAFERLFGIIRDEGLLDGDIVVQDCFQLLAALLRGSPPNQLMFRETGFLAQLPAILRLPEAGSGGDDSAAELPPQKAANLVAALEVVLALLPPAAAEPTAPICSSQAENRQALLQRGLRDVLLSLALQHGGVSDDGVRAQALLCLAALVGASRLQQDQLAAVSIKRLSGEAVPLLQAVLQVAVAADTPAEQVAADRLLEAYCCGNSSGQSVLAGSLLHAAPAAPGSFGGYLLASLGRQGGLDELAASSRAAAALSHLVSGNPSLQAGLLALQVQQQRQAAAPGGISAGGGGSSSLMSLCATHLGLLVTQLGQQQGSVAAAADMLRLLLLWLHACPPAVTAFLRAVAQSQPFLVDSIRRSNACSSSASSSHPLTRGMLALLLGLCASHAEDAAGTPTQQQLRDAISKQIGQQQFQGVVDALLQHTAASSSASWSIADKGPATSPAFAAFLKALAAEVRQRLTGAPALPTAAAAKAQQQEPPPPPPMFTAPPLPSRTPPAAASGSPAAWAGQQARAASALAAAAQPLPPPPTFLSRPSTPHSASPALAGPPAFLPAGYAAHPSGNGAAPNSYPAQSSAMAVTGADNGSAGRLQQALAAVDNLQRENQQLRAEKAAIAERLRVSITSTGMIDNKAQAAAAEVQELAAEAAAARQQLATSQQQLAVAQRDLDAVQQQVAEAHQQLAEAQAEVQRGRIDAQAAQAAAQKVERDLEDLSAAYGTLDAHAGSLQQQVEQLEQDLAAARQQQAAGGTCQSSGGGMTDAEVQRQLEAVRQEVQEEADDAMGDLLVCLGHEEAKVARLRERLEAYGIDCDALLADIVAAGDDEL